MERPLLAAAFLLLIACGKDDGSGPPPTVSAVEVTPASVSLPAGSTLQLTATLKDANGVVLDGPTVEWTSSLPTVAGVSGTGLLEAHAAGQATVTATADGVSGTAAITVLAPVASVVLSPSPVAVAPTRTVQLTAVLRDANGTILTDRAITWTSSAPAIATVDAAGLVTGVTVGSVTVTASVEGVEATAEVTVDPAAAVATVEVTPAGVSVSQGGTVQLTATLRNAANDVLLGHPVQWASGDNGKVTVTPTGLVTAVAVGGPISVTAAAEGVFGTALVTITPPAVSSVTLTPDDLAFVPGGEIHFAAQVRDAGGNTLIDRTVTWTSSVPGVVSVGATQPFKYDIGYPVTVTGLSEGTSTLTATADGVSGQATLTVHRASFSSASLGNAVTCARDVGGRAFCWGAGDVGQLGAGFIPSLSGFQPTPLLSQATLTFTAVSIGGATACGLTAAGKAWCWGYADLGSLGAGSLPGACNANYPLNHCSPVALPVSGDLVFTQITTGVWHVCVLTAGGIAYCWGADHVGQGGSAPTADCAGYACNLTPTAVLGSHVFEEISAGGQHTCGRTSSGAVYCWGNNSDGQLGNPAAGESSATPVLVAGGIAFAQIAAGGNHTCGLDGAGAAFCWGTNTFGELGTGSADASAATPQPVFGGILFSSITASYYTTCATAASGGRCWGRGDYGALGTGSLGSSTIPALVSGGNDFAQLAAGPYGTCGVTTSGRLLCWPAGETLVPVEVIGQP